ncbi:MAG: glucosaminidase domain-containing protein [Vagococcus sp.]
MNKKLVSIFMIATFMSGTLSPVMALADVLPAIEQSQETEKTKETDETTDTTESEESTEETTTSSSEETDATESTTENSTEDTGTENTTESSSGSKPETSDTKPVEKPKPTPKPKPDKKPVTKPKETKPNKKVSQPAKGSQSGKTDAFVSSSEIKYIKNQSTEDFIESIGDKAREIGQEYELYASVMIAQAILESGAGTSQLSQAPNHNLFGIKGAYEGKSVSFNTNEDNGKGQMYSVQAKFRKYPGYKESFEDYALLITKGITGGSAIYEGTWKKNAKTYKDATKALTGKYATDVKYDEKLNKLIETYDLQFFDQKLNGDAKIQNIYYDVQKNDTVESIVTKHHLVKEDFMKWNKEIIKDEKKLDKVSRVIIGQRKLATYKIKNVATKKENDFIIPLKTGYVVSSPYGARWGTTHMGIDLAVAANTPIYASSKGVVAQKGFDPSAGNYVILKHDNGVYTNYFHMSRSAVSSIQGVEMGELIGYVGSTGDSTGAHLHFGVSTEPWSNYMNPANYFDFSK